LINLGLERRVDTVLRIGPFDCGTRGWTAQRTYPLAAGPDNLPVITDARTAAKNLALANNALQDEGKGILSVLEVRGILVSDSVRERITTCTDLDRLDTWLERSRTVARAEDLFAEDPA
jgi:hypothetical protein